MKRYFAIVFVALFLFPSISIGEEKICTYEELMNYGELFENDGKNGLEPIKIEAVIGKVNTEDYFDNILFDVWIKGQNGYGYHAEEIMSSVKKLTGYPHEIISGQRIIYELFPQVNGRFFGENISS